MYVAPRRVKPCSPWLVSCFVLRLFPSSSPCVASAIAARAKPRGGGGRNHPSAMTLGHWLSKISRRIVFLGSFFRCVLLGYLHSIWSPLHLAPISGSFRLKKILRALWNREWSLEQTTTTVAHMRLFFLVFRVYVCVLAFVCVCVKRAFLFDGRRGSHLDGSIVAQDGDLNGIVTCIFGSYLWGEFGVPYEKKACFWRVLPEWSRLPPPPPPPSPDQE